MNPIANLCIAMGVIILFISSLVIITGTELEILDFSEEETPVEFALSGDSGVLMFSESMNPESPGWAVYVFGDYVDLDENGMWDYCESVEIFAWSEGSEKPPELTHENNSFFSLCGAGFERYDMVDQSLVYIGHVCHDPSNQTVSQCSDGNYTFESNLYSKLVADKEGTPQSFLSKLMNNIISGFRTGWTLLCGSFLLILIGITLAILLKEEEGPVSEKKSNANKVEWKAYSLAQAERGADGMPKAFSKHINRNLNKKPRKGNLRGGVHKTGGLFLDGWTEDDSNKEYKKKVKDRRNT